MLASLRGTWIAGDLRAAPVVGQRIDRAEPLDDAVTEHGQRHDAAVRIAVGDHEPRLGEDRRELDEMDVRSGAPSARGTRRARRGASTAAVAPRAGSSRTPDRGRPGEEPPPRGHARARRPASIDTESMKPHTHSSGSVGVHPVHVFEQRPAEPVDRGLHRGDPRRRCRRSPSPAAARAPGAPTGAGPRASRCRASRLWSSVVPLRSMPVMYTIGGIGTAAISGLSPQRLEDAQPPHDIQHRPRSQEPAPELVEVGLLESSAYAVSGPEEPVSPKSSSPAFRPPQRGCARLPRSCPSSPPLLRFRFLPSTGLRRQGASTLRRQSVEGVNVESPGGHRNWLRPGLFGADDGIRTRDPHLGKVMLYH